jgi:endonuclease YncB( thermonuclease family)
MAQGLWALAAATGLAAAPTPSPVVSGAALPALSADWTGEAPGQVIVVTGDLLLIRGQPVRLADIAAPLPAQRCNAGRGFVACGTAAAEFLRALVGAGPVSCRILGTEPTPWVQAKAVWLGSCQARGEDLGQGLIRSGYALARPGSGYVGESLSACMARRGVWAWSVESPWTFAARRDGADMRPIFIGAGSGTPCLRALEAPRLR